MTTRVVSGIIRHPDGTPWAGAAVHWRLLEVFAASDGTYPIDDVTSTADETGFMSQALGVPDDPAAAAHWRCDLPGIAMFACYLSAGVGAMPLGSLIVQALTSGEANSLAVLVDAHASEHASTSALAHVIVDGVTIVIDADGVISSVGADPSGTAVGLVATEATARATADSDHAGAADPHPGYLTAVEGDAAYQPKDSDLTAIAALATTAYGRALLALADAAAGRAALGAAPATPLTQALTDQASIAWNTALGAFATLTIGGNRTLANPTNLTAGASYALKITQDGVGGRTLAYGSAFKWAGGAAPVLSTAIGAVDVLTCISDGTNLYSVLQKAWA
jgi:hypothetical protein